MMARKQTKTGLTAVSVQDFMTLREVARYAGVRPSAVSNWKRRHDDFPNPVDVSSSGTLYRRSDILDWLTRHGKLGPDTEHPEGFETWETAASLGHRADAEGDEPRRCSEDRAVNPAPRSDQSKDPCCDGEAGIRSSVRSRFRSIRAQERLS
jgi:predicted DNA-binding transcriptional regulator AlpA